MCSVVKLKGGVTMCNRDVVVCVEPFILVPIYSEEVGFAGTYEILGYRREYV